MIFPPARSRTRGSGPFQVATVAPRLRGICARRAHRRPARPKGLDRPADPALSLRSRDGRLFLASLGDSSRREEARAARVPGFSVTEMVVVLAIAASVTAVAAPTAFELRSAVAVRSAAGEVRAALYRGRAQAIARCRNVGLKFRKNGDRHEWALYVDGNGNGVRTAEITNGIDKPLGFAIPWGRNDVFPGILTGTPVPDPADPRKTLDRTDDPIRFNSSDICSFSEVGESTPGSIYLWDGHDRMAVIRVFGRTAKVRTLYYRRGEKEWKP